MTQHPAHPPRRGVLVIVSSPSGAGKTTLTRRLLSEFANDLEFSVSYTTRPMRPGEHEGVDYHFIDRATFDHMVATEQFAEHAMVHGNHYGTAKVPVEQALASGRDIVFDVDWQGAGSLSRQWPNDSLTIFILPPDLDTLAERLRRRATDAPDVIQRRLQKAIEELGHYMEYENLIVNDDLDRAYQVMRAMYLDRRGDPATEEDCHPASPAGFLARLIEANHATHPEKHAQRLIAAGQSWLP